MKIGLIGVGVVGRAVEQSAQPGTLVVRRDQGGSLAEILTCDIVMVCVGTPSLPSGACDTSALENTFKALAPFKGWIICHSTAPAEIYSQYTRPNVVYIPEFVRASDAAQEYKLQKKLVIGAWSWQIASDVYVAMKQLFCPYLEDFVWMSPESACMVKYMANTMLALKVGFLNEVQPLCTKVGADWHDVIGFLSSDARFGETHWSVPGPDGQYGFGGMCFPKDLDALIAQLVDHKIPPILTSSLRVGNQLWRKRSS